ncbi:MAG: EAL domain-containing protein [Sulfuritalea sp.]|nr:EAL domain-containing protein [Sulfuritalea sp.]
MQWFREIVENQQAGVAVYAAVDDGADFSIRYLNPAGKSLCPTLRDAPAGGRLVEVCPAFAQIGLLDVFRRVWRSGAPETFVVLCPLDDGAQRHFEHQVFKLGAGEIASLFADVSARVEAQESLRQSEAKLRQAQAIARIGSWHLDVQRDQLSWSDETCRIFGVPPGTSLRYADFLARIPADERETVDAAWQAALAGAPYDITHRIRVDGQIRWVRERAELQFDADGALAAGVGTVQDVTENKRVRDTSLLFARVFKNSGEAALITDRHNRIVAINDAFTRVTGYTLDEVRGQNPSLLGSGRTPPETYRQMWAALAAAGYWQGELWDRRKSGEVFPKWAAISAIRDRSGKVSHYVGTFNDISDRKAVEERIRYLALHDALTGLANRHCFESRLEQALLSAEREKSSLAVLFIDLDRFKTINDTLGHPVGDQLLQEAARRLQACVRASDIVARLGGDEFVVVLSQVAAPADAAAVADKILQSLASPYAIEGQRLHVTASVGIGVYPDDGGDAVALMKNADTALYHAKDTGRNQFQFFKAAMNEAVAELLLLERELRGALRQGEFELHYQPKVMAGSGRVCGVEALLRWRHPELGLVPPLKFVPLAEEVGLIEAIGAWVLEEACRQLAAWRAAGIDGLHMAVNLSARQLRSAELVTTVRDLIARHGLGEGDLELEITESVAMAEPEIAIGRLQALRALGVRLAIDDFGTGYSSLAYLKRLPIQTLKLDRAFVRDIEFDPNDAAISTATLALAHNLGLQVVAEGVENAAQRDFLIHHGCDMLQGYLYGRPAPGADWIASWTASAP